MQGEVVYLYAFDVANEIVTERIQEILAHKPVPFEIRMHRTFPRDVPLYRPLAVEPPPLPERLDQQPVRLLIRIYDVGVVTVAMRVAFDKETLQDLLPFHNATLDNGRSLDQVARELCADVCRSLGDALVRGQAPPEPEAYTVFCLTNLGPVTDANRWLIDEQRCVAGLLSEARPDRLSDAQVGDALRIQRSYEKTDVVVIDWDAALVVDLTGYVEDVLYVLELANLQLEEFRVMDERLDRYFNQVYDDIERSRPPWFGVAPPILRTLRYFRIDVARLADEVTHITKFFGDWYLARVYLGARDRFHLDHWRQSVEQRLSQLDQLYSVVHAEVYERRMIWLELIIVILFVLDLLGLFFLKG